ncbi:MAG: penicillin-binding protein 2, partial [Azoarcus sp.]|nr:penicillin-binding protein 2 [Azoarcus sp.]
MGFLLVALLPFAQGNHVFAAAIQDKTPPPAEFRRGEIVDRNGVTLAHDVVVHSLEITIEKPPVLSEQDELIDRLAAIIAITPGDRARFYEKNSRNYMFRAEPIRDRLSREEVARFIEQRHRFPNVAVKERLVREYPHGTLASHLIGYIGRISEKDVERIEARGETAKYRDTEKIGKAGVEATYEADLHGKPTGGKIELTMDIELQKAAEAAFGKRRGALVAIEPASGEVLALASMPTFDPNLFVDGISGPDWRMLSESPDKPLLNRAISRAYPPGSTFTPFMALAGLAAGKRTVNQSYPDPGGFQFDNHFFKDSKKGGHGMVNLHKSIVVSCDTYYYVLANDLGIDAIAASMAWFGLGARTGVDLPGEGAGFLPSPAWKLKYFKTREQQKWYAGETISVGIGQGYNAYTPIQMANALAAVVNGGKLMRPRVVR